KPSSEHVTTTRQRFQELVVNDLHCKSITSRRLLRIGRAHHPLNENKVFGELPNLIVCVKLGGSQLMREEISDAAHSMEVLVRILRQNADQQGKVDLCSEAAKRAARPEEVLLDRRHVGHHRLKS